MENKLENEFPTKQVHRPQEPQPPFPYRVEEVSFTNAAAGVTLAGTLTMPLYNPPHTAVILIAGMGAGDRDSTMAGHKLFWVLADYLTWRGIAVLRFDKRGVGKSTGTFDTSLTSRDVADDVLAAVAYLKTRTDIRPDQIGLIGHSEGGLVAALVAAQCPDVAFLVSMAGMATTDIPALVEEAGLQLKADGASDELVAQSSKLWDSLLSVAKSEPDEQQATQQMHTLITAYWKALPAELKREAATVPFATTDANATDTIASLNSPQYRFLLNHRPEETLAKLTIPILALNGSLDFIVAAHINLPRITQVLKKAGNDKATITELPSMNHWFQRCKKGSFAEYGELEETMSEQAMSLISDWIAQECNRR